MHVTDTKVDSKLPHLVTELPGPKAKKLVERDHHVVSPSYTRDYPLVAKVGRGATDFPISITGFATPALSQSFSSGWFVTTCPTKCLEPLGRAFTITIFISER